MKKITAVILLLLSICGHSQSRENDEILKFINYSKKITSATGWKKNTTTGKWINNKNLIYDRESKYVESHISQSFKWIQFRTLKFNGELKYIFIYEKISGKYKYPNIREDWETELNTWFLIFNENDFIKIKDEVENQSGEIVKISSKLKDKITDRYKILGGEHLYNNENLLVSIKNTLQKSGSSSTRELMFNSQKVDNGEVVRFLLPTYLRSSTKPLENYYFEISKSDFIKIFDFN